MSDYITATVELPDGSELDIEVEYDGHYSPAYRRGHIDNWEPEDSEIRLERARVDGAKRWEDFDAFAEEHGLGAATIRGLEDDAVEDMRENTPCDASSRRRLRAEYYADLGED